MLGAINWPQPQDALGYGRLMSSLWVGRINAQGKHLPLVRVPIPHEVDGGSYPMWIDGTIAALFGGGTNGAY